jgi:hypothetical protein
LDARYCSLSRVSFGLKLVGAEAARVAARGRKPALPVWISFAVQLRRRAPTSPPPLVRPPRAAGGASLITTTRPPVAPSAWVTGPVSLACHSAASAGPECCVHRIASSGRLRRPRGYRTVRSQAATSAGPECCVHRIASSGRLRRPRGYRTVRSQDTLLQFLGAPRVVGLSSWAATGPACSQWDLAPSQPHAGPRGRAPALLSVAGVASPRAQARLQLLDSDGVGPDGAGRPDSDGDSGPGPDYGPARTRCHVSPRSRMRLAVNVPPVPGPRASRTPASPALGVKHSFCIAAFKRHHLRRCCS